jgi:protein transport protein SEC24
MAAPQGGYPPQDDYTQNPAEQQDQARHDAGSPPDSAAGSVPASTAAGGRKKRAYAGQAYDFGAGANSALGGQQAGGGAYEGGFSQQAHEAGYPQGGYQQSAAAPAQTPGIGHQPVAGVGGYQPPTPAYPVQQAAMNSMTQQFGQMDMSQKQAPSAPLSRPQALNQLYPTDLLNSPFNVAELDYPPPPAILPPNVSGSVFVQGSPTDLSRQASHPRHTRIALPSTFDQPLTQFQPPTLYSKSLASLSPSSFNRILRYTMLKTLSQSYLTRSSHDVEGVDLTSTHS